MRLLIRCARWLVAVLLFPLSALRYWRRAPHGAWLELTLDGAVDDVLAPPKFWDRFRRRPLSLHALREALDLAAGDARVRGLLVTLRSFQGGMASAASLREALRSFRGRGKELAVHLPQGADTREVFLASAASRVVVCPQATVAPLGFAARARYLKSALQKAGIEPTVLSRGAYKSAGEMLTRDEMSAAQREQTGRILDGLHGALLEAIAERPGLDRAKAQALVDGGPYSGEEAVANGLCDAAAYDDEVPAALGEKDRERLIPLHQYLRGRRALRLPRVLPASVIGVVRVHGGIVGGSPGPFASGGEEPIVSAIRAARKSRRIKAVVLHVNSPGGGALASDRIHHELAQLAQEKPLVACFADVAASGGYYVAATAHEIVARPETITGSIGVVAARFSAEPLLAKLGISSSSLQRGARAHLADPLAPLGDGDREALERELDSFYKTFLEVVARGRKRSVEDVRAVAEGRVWTGADAHARGLVDTLGDFQVALQAARTRAGKGGSKLEPVLIEGARRAGAPLDPPKLKAQALALLLGADGLELAALVADPRQRALLWCGLAAALAA